MEDSMRKLLAVLLACSPLTTTLAASMNKCDDGRGHITFTQQACPDGSGGEPIKVVPATDGMRIGQPPPPDVTADAQADTNATPGKSPAEDNPKVRVTVVGADPASECGPYTEAEIHTAKVRNQVLVGMHTADVLKIWGEPSRTRGNVWVYNLNDCSAQYLDIDGRGCVTSSYEGDGPRMATCYYEQLRDRYGPDWPNQDARRP